MLYEAVADGTGFRAQLQAWHFAVHGFARFHDSGCNVSVKHFACLHLHFLIYVFIRIEHSICEGFGVYRESTFAWNAAYLYIVAINNVSQFTAMYCLVLFHKANRVSPCVIRYAYISCYWRADIWSVFKRRWNWAQCVRGQSFCASKLSFSSRFCTYDHINYNAIGVTIIWIVSIHSQSVLITFLVYFGYVGNIFGTTDAGDDDYKNLASKLQDFLICIEMFLAAVAHKYSFPHWPFHINIPNYSVSSSDTWYQWIGAMCDVSDVRADVSDHFVVMGSSMVRRWVFGQSCYCNISYYKLVFFIVFAARLTIN